MARAERVRGVIAIKAPLNHLGAAGACQATGWDHRQFSWVSETAPLHGQQGRFEWPQSPAVPAGGLGSLTGCAHSEEARGH